MVLRIPAAGLLALLTLSDAARAAPDIAGYYLMPPNSLLASPWRAATVVALYPCNTDKFCGRIMALGDLPATDAKNPEPARRQRALCGLQILELQQPLRVARHRPAAPDLDARRRRFGDMQGYPGLELRRG